MIPTDILNYRVVRLLGSGGMGSVYLAVNTNIDQEVAIKVLRPEFARNAELRAKFKKEAQLLCSLDHPGIVKFINYVEKPEGVFLIMEYVKGITLEDFIKKKNGLIVESKAYPLIKEILEAFEYAHSKGIVHQDIKPSNIIIQEDGHIKIMDFGIAQIVSESQHNGAVMGTPEYMSPEQIYGNAIDTRSDIYSLGVLIHNMLTGKAPYDTTRLTEQEIKHRVVKDELPRMNECYPYISDKIQKVVDKATDKLPESRFQSCSEMKVAVKKALNPDRIPKPLLYGGVAALVVAVVAAFFTWDYFRLKVNYYADYVEVYGIPKGIGKLSSREVSHRQSSYRFESQKGKVRRVSHVNSLGKVVPQRDSEAIDKIVDMKLTYSEGDGKVDTEVFMNQSGKVLYVKDYDSNLKTCTFRLNDELGTEMTLNSQVALFESSFDNSANKGKSKISKYILEFDDNGYLSKVEYAGFGNVRVPDGQGIFGRKYVHDKDGRVIEEHYLGKDGTPKSTQFGLGKKKFTYDDDGRMSKIVYLTVDDKPSSDGNNCPVVDLTYDKWGNRISEKYSDMDGNPMLRKDNQVAGFIYEYNDLGQCVKYQFIGIDGGATYYNGANGFVNEYDSNGFQSKRTFIDAKGNMAVWNEDDLSYSILETDNDELGNLTELRILDSKGKLIDTSSFARKVCQYDSVGNLLAETYLDDKGNISVPPKFGYAGYILTYNPQGRVAKVTYIGKDKKPMLLPDVHYCYYTMDYDVRGNLSGLSYFDKDGKPVMNNEGIAAVGYEYDENGNEKSRQFYDDKGKPCVLNWYCSKVEYDYDDQGNVKAYRYMSTDGKPMLVNGMAACEFEYDNRGNKVRERPLGLTGSLAAGCFDLRMKYDNLDNVIESAYFNAAGKPVACADGYHREVMKYNSNNQCIEKEFYGTNGSLVNVGNNKCAVIKSEYDARGNKISETYFSSDGSRGTDGNKVHKYYNQYDKVTNKISHQISFGANGQPIVANNTAAEGRLEYDPRGNVIRLQCLDGYGKKINGMRGWYETVYEYNDAGDMTSEAYFSIDEKPVKDNTLGYHKSTLEYNDMRMPQSQAYYDVNGKLTLVGSGYAIEKRKYNNQNQRTEIAYFGVNSKPVDTKNGWHKEVYSYSNGKEAHVDLFDKSGRKIASANKVNGQWKFKESGVTGFQNDQSWKDFWREVAGECPYDTGEGVTIDKVEVGSDYVTVYLSLDSSVDSVSESDMMDFKKQLSKFLRTESKTPAHIAINIQISMQSNLEFAI